MAHLGTPAHGRGLYWTILLPILLLIQRPCRAAAYWSASIDGKTIKDIAWWVFCIALTLGTRSLISVVRRRSYPHPKDAAKNIAGYYAFDKVCCIDQSPSLLCPLIVRQKQVALEG